MYFLRMIKINCRRFLGSLSTNVMTLFTYIFLSTKVIWDYGLARNLHPEIQKPAVQAKTDKSIKTLVEEPAKTTVGPVITRVQKCTDPVVPVIQRSTKEKITINGRIHSLPTTKDYLLQECANVQHPPHQVAVSLKSLYKAELERLTQLGVIKEVREHTEWINLIVPVKKLDGSLWLCLDPKDLNWVIKRNQWYSRTVNDILPELADSKYFSVLDMKAHSSWEIA